MHDKVQSSQRLARLSNYHRNVKKRKVGLSHGCFDVLGPGHIEHLRQAKEMCDVLIVTVSSDEVVKETKGPERPIIPAVDRVRHLAALEFVDYVSVWNLRDASTLIMNIKPNVFIKGEDTREHMSEAFMREKEKCLAGQTRIAYTTTHTPYHTTDIVKAIEGAESSPTEPFATPPRKRPPGSRKPRPRF
jgi:rfaE bifunctional protein nucleotidyltransferase chain/domain